jgi:hypothetical protein
VCFERFREPFESLVHGYRPSVCVQYPREEIDPLIAKRKGSDGIWASLNAECMSIYNGGRIEA